MNTKAVFRQMIIGGLTILMALLITACQSSEATNSPAVDEHDEHSGHDDHDDEYALHIDAATLEEFGIVLTTSGSGNLHREIQLPGQVRLSQDHVAHVTPTVPGNVHEVFVKEGDHVQSGDILAIIHSEQLASTKSALLVAREQVVLAESTYNRVKTLNDDRISSVEELQIAERDLQSAQIALLSAEQALHAFGLSDTSIRSIHADSSTMLSHQELTAPFSGRIIQRDIVQGQFVSEETDAFVVADMSTVWVDAEVYPRDLGIIREGMEIDVIAGYGIPTVAGRLNYVGPVVGKDTRTAVARAEVRNPDGLLRPGLFATVKVATESFPVAISVPRTALVQMEGRPHIFVQEGGEFHPVEVVIGMENDTHVEITNGLALGQTYVSENGFILKAEMEKGSFGDDHGH